MHNLWMARMPDGAPALVRRLRALPEPIMREVVLVEELTRAPALVAVQLLGELITAARSGRAPDDIIAATAMAGALGRLPYGTSASLYEAAKMNARGDVARLFFSSVDDDGEPPEPERYVPAAGRALTLGERKALARGGRRELLLALLADPDAQVIRALLENPRLTEKEVVTVAARRPVRADVLRAIFGSRWLARYHVKRALVMNPWTPVELAVRLLPALVAADRRLVADDANLAPVVRQAARG
jgi:hypothetical protein